MKSVVSDQGKLSIIPTPIGNLEDMTLRGLRLLKEADLIAAEDTRRTQKLLNHFKIATPFISYYKEVEKRKAPALIEKMKNGTHIALVTDAGLPGISDPGQLLIAKAREAFINIEVLPGPSAVMTALIGSGLALEAFSFYGFPEAKQRSRRKQFEVLKNRPETMVFFVSPHKLIDILKDMAGSWGERQVVLCREMTKIYEEFVFGGFEELIEKFKDKILGEMTLIVSGCLNPIVEIAESMDEHLKRCQDEGCTLNQAVAKVAKERELKRQVVYQYAHKLFKKEI